MTDEELLAIGEAIRLGNFYRGQMKALFCEAYRAREAENALRADITIMERAFRDMGQIEKPALELANRQGYEDGRRAVTWQECYEVVCSSPWVTVEFTDFSSRISAVSYPPGTTLATTMMPRYVHDCEHCTFLGWHEQHDLYHCGVSQVAGLTVIARYGDDGPEYTSGILLAPQVPALAEALRRATERGLNVQSPFTVGGG